MKLFLQRSNRLYISNIFSVMLCVSCLFTGYIRDNLVNNIEENDPKAVEALEEIDPLSQMGIEGNGQTRKTTSVVTRQISYSGVSYKPAVYDSVTGDAIVNYAKRYLGLRYVSGGNSLTTGTDCSGFTKLIYKEFGITLSRSVSTQAYNGSYIRKSDLQKGDLVFYGYNDGKVHHVAIYIGNGQVIHESTYKYGVKISPLNMMEYITARRVIPAPKPVVKEETTVETTIDSSEKIEEELNNSNDGSNVVIGDISNDNNDSGNINLGDNSTTENEDLVETKPVVEEVETKPESVAPPKEEIVETPSSDTSLSTESTEE